MFIHELCWLVAWLQCISLRVTGHYTTSRYPSGALVITVVTTSLPPKELAALATLDYCLWNGRIKWSLRQLREIGCFSHFSDLTVCLSGSILYYTWFSQTVWQGHRNWKYKLGLPKLHFNVIINNTSLNMNMCTYHININMCTW